MALRTITLRGFKSIASLENFEMRNINLLIGANGSGKSNFLSAFKFLAKVAQGNLQNHITKEGGADVFLHGGRKRTSNLEFEVVFCGVDDDLMSDGDYDAGYRFSLDVTSNGRFYFSNEEIYPVNGLFGRWHPLGRLHEEARLLKSRSHEVENVVKSLASFRQYHFHDTGPEARIKQKQKAINSLRLQETADNLAAYLNFIRNNYYDNYINIIETIRMVAPFFGDFVEIEGESDYVQIIWFERAEVDVLYNAHSLSDGTLRFICLTTLLLQPLELLPDTILIDEPELGLHPYAISLLAEMIKQVAETKQVVIATQSVELLNHFAPEDVVVADREGAATVLRRLNADDLSEWLKSYSLGELWQKNVLGGRPV